MEHSERDKMDTLMAERHYVMECYLHTLGQWPRPRERFEALCRYLQGPLRWPLLSPVLRAIASQSDLRDEKVHKLVAASLSKEEQRAAVAHMISEKHRCGPPYRGITNTDWMLGPSFGMSRGWILDEASRPAQGALF